MTSEGISRQSLGRRLENGALVARVEVAGCLHPVRTYGRWYAARPVQPYGSKCSDR